MTECVVDASSSLVVLRVEPGADLPLDAFGDGVRFMSAVNATEVITRLIDLGLAEDDATLAIGFTPFRDRPIHGQRRKTSSRTPAYHSARWLESRRPGVSRARR